VQELATSDVLTLPDILPGFSLPLALLFKERGRNS
jgi:hypothetical protein